MAKRFTDTDKYKKPFIRRLPLEYKVFWDYLYHECNHAGIWIVDFEIACIYLSANIEKQKALELFNKDEIRIIELNHGSKWFIPSFIDFQYGELNQNNRAHNSVIQILKKYNLINNKGLTRGLQAYKDKDIDKDKVKDKESVEEIYNLYPSNCPIKKTSTNKCKKDKEKIARLLKEKEKGDIIKTINEYIEECENKKIWIKNFSTFLNNFPEKENYDLKNMSIEEVEKLLDEGKIT